MKIASQIVCYIESIKQEEKMQCDNSLYFFPFFELPYPDDKALGHGIHKLCDALTGELLNRHI